MHHGFYSFLGGLLAQISCHNLLRRKTKALGQKKKKRPGVQANEYTNTKLQKKKPPQKPAHWYALATILM